MDLEVLVNDIEASNCTYFRVIELHRQQKLNLILVTLLVPLFCQLMYAHNVRLATPVPQRKI